MQFLLKMPLNFFHTMVQKVENDQNLKSSVPASINRTKTDLIIFFFVQFLHPASVR